MSDDYNQDEKREQVVLVDKIANSMERGNWHYRLGHDEDGEKVQQKGREADSMIKKWWMTGETSIDDVILSWLVADKTVTTVGGYMLVEVTSCW